jgi:glycosyltransferase involved in cell wall biosynthesis
MRFAWFSPWPPQPSGVAGRSAELVPALAERGHAVDVFVDECDARLAGVIARHADSEPASGEIRIQSAHDFVWRSGRGQYDLTVYQVGNSQLHEYIWPYLFQWPGLVLLHDARLHHARGRALLRTRRANAYRAEFRWSHPNVSPDLAELAIRGFDGPYYYQWPMTRAVVEAARLVACHSRGAAAELREQFPDKRIDYVALGEGPADDMTAAGAAFRAAHALGPSTVVFGVHGALTAEKRVPQILRAFAALRPWIGGAHLLLAGRPDPALDLPRLIDTLALHDVVHVIGSLDAAAFDASIAACDVTLNLRWPTALETSGPWVRSLAMSRATVILDLAHQGHLAVLDPRTWRRHAPCGDTSSDADARAIAVAIDVLDEEHSLRLAIRRLADDAALRDRIGRAARAYWEREHTVARMIDDVERSATAAAQIPASDVDLPAHLRPEPLEHFRTLVEPFGPFPVDDRSL